MKRKQKEYDESRELRCKGLTITKIATQLGVAKSSVYEWTKDLPVTKKRTQKPRPKPKRNRRVRKRKERVVSKDESIDKNKVCLPDYLIQFLRDVRKVHGPYKRKDGRSHVIIVYDSGIKRTVSYPKFLAEVAIGRELDRDTETVDHVDGDFTNNSWSNIRIVSRKQHASDDALILKKHLVKCVWCGKLVRKNPRQLNHAAKLNKSGPFCSRECVGIYGAELQNGRCQPIPAQKAFPVTKRKYYKRGKHTKIRLSDMIDSSITEQDIRSICGKKIKSAYAKR